MTSIAQNEHKVNTKRATETLDLADTCLEKANFYWARWLVSCDIAHYRLALAYFDDRETLLKDFNKRVGEGNRA